MITFYYKQLQTYQNEVRKENLAQKFRSLSSWKNQLYILQPLSNANCKGERLSQYIDLSPFSTTKQVSYAVVIEDTMYTVYC